MTPELRKAIDEAYHKAGFNATFEPGFIAGDRFGYNRAKMEFEGEIQRLKKKRLNLLDVIRYGRKQRLVYEAKVKELNDLIMPIIEYGQRQDWTVGTSITNELIKRSERLKELEYLLADKEEWISVSDKLPEIDANYQVFSDDEIITAGFNSKKQTWTDACFTFVTEYVTHWRPLPKPPIDTKEK